MSLTLIVIPGSPALVTELAPADEAGQDLLLLLRSQLDRELSSNGMGIDLVGSQDQRWFTTHCGSFKAWGASTVDVGVGNFLPELVARYVLGSYSERIEQVRAEIGALRSDVVTLVTADGSTGLTDRAPSALLPGAAEIDRWSQDLLSGQRVAAPTFQGLIDAGVVEPNLWIELYRLSDRLISAELIAADTSFGVGRYGAVWRLSDEWGRDK